MQNQIKDSLGRARGWSEDRGNEIWYFTYKKGLVGRFDKRTQRYWYMAASGRTDYGPMADIGVSEVLRIGK